MEKYSNQLSSLKTAKMAGVQAPHKPILLLSIIDLIECGAINENHISLSEELERVFKSNWLRYVGSSVLFQPKVATPFWHLQNEPFWRLIRPDSGVIDMSSSKPIYAVGSIRKQGIYAEIDEKLFELLQSAEIRAKIRVLLISTYLNNKPLQTTEIIPMITLIGTVLLPIAS